QAVVSKHIIKKETGNISLFAFDKGEGLSEHTAPFDAVVHVIDGEADIIIDGKSNLLHAGETIIMPANLPHALIAIERFKMVLTMIRK
ncbi:MAG: cupin domain-containing protein, partial [Bacteroidetes bacterium]|nr:cupin domain-containing protein [Bacteroidota bacterium]